MTQQPEERQKNRGEGYNTVAETVGLIPSLRLRDNVIQGITVVVVTGIAALVGLLTDGTEGLAIGSLLGLVGSLLISGAVLMVVGWVRAARNLSK